MLPCGLERVPLLSGLRARSSEPASPCWGESGEHVGAKGCGRGGQMAAQMPLLMFVISPVPASERGVGLLKILRHT